MNVLFLIEQTPRTQTIHCRRHTTRHKHVALIGEVCYNTKAEHLCMSVFYRAVIITLRAYIHPSEVSQGGKKTGLRPFRLLKAFGADWIFL